MFSRLASLRRVSSIALTVAALLLFAQSLSTAHFHHKDLKGSFTQSIEVTDALCALCLFYFHSPTNSSTAPIANAAAVVEWHITPLACVPLFACSFSSLFSRAPPTSL
jgi:hypothetical protein